MKHTLGWTGLLMLATLAQTYPQIARVIPSLPVDYSLMRHHNYLARKSALEAHAVINHAAYHQRDVVRPSPAQSPSASAIALPAASPPANAASSSPNDWRNQTAAACMKSLTALGGQASNPSGLAACYNIKSLDTTTGVFEADLQLYRIAAASGDWVSLMTQAVNVGLSYSDATVAPSNTNRKRGLQTPPTATMKTSEVQRLKVERAAVAAPSMVQDMSFVGKINTNAMNQLNDTAKERNLLVPNIALSGTDKSGKVITTELSSSEASLVNGIFAQQTTTTTSAGASASSAAAQAAVFVLPGRSLGIFPTGLIITGSWTLLFIATVGYGTVERIRFREAYRRRVKYRLALNAKQIQGPGVTRWQGLQHKAEIDEEGGGRDIGAGEEVWRLIDGKDHIEKTCEDEEVGELHRDSRSMN
ncbi:MAG: hypothetical protein Q9220_003796 [cf. Caloplaca sp. 1 TL-2023]